ncbi:MAG TPA: carboxypeptidase-like regulatory domain-containing protein, partial [Thermoanaerobaculia bacterium]|nr:carboxypeptidase-like regulatory domain-containing protein [Thermoanaerobaculia bacterium]
MYGKTTASLTGTATTGGQPLAGVTVTISSPALQGTRTAVTGDSGAYEFASLPPGEYLAVFTKTGYVAPKIRSVLRLSQTTRVDVAMLATLSTTITITAATEPAIETPQISTNLPLQQIERLPVLRNQLATAQFAPGVNGNTLSNGQLYISGGPGYDNLVLVNGVVVTENTRGQMRPMYVEDAIQETTVLTGAISAEYGRFSGGVVSTI